MSTLWPKALEVLVVPQGYQTQITDTTRVHIVALALLSVLSKSVPHLDLTDGANSMHIIVSRWTLDICHRLLKTSRSCIDKPSQDMDQILSTLISSVFEAYPVDDASINVGPLLDLFVEVLWAFKHYGGTALHKALYDMIHHLLRDDQQSIVLEACKRRLVPLLSTRKAEDMDLEQVDFQVSTSHSRSVTW